MSGMRIMGSAITMTTTAVPFYYNWFWSPSCACQTLQAPQPLKHQMTMLLVRLLPMYQSQCCCTRATLPPVLPHWVSECAVSLGGTVSPSASCNICTYVSFRLAVTISCCSDQNPTPAPSLNFAAAHVSLPEHMMMQPMCCCDSRLMSGKQLTPKDVT